MKDSTFSDAWRAFILKQGAGGIPVADIRQGIYFASRTFDSPRRSKEYEELLPAEM